MTRISSKLVNFSEFNTLKITPIDSTQPAIVIAQESYEIKTFTLYIKPVLTEQKTIKPEYKVFSSISYRGGTIPREDLDINFNRHTGTVSVKINTPTLKITEGAMIYFDGFI